MPITAMTPSSDDRQRLQTPSFHNGRPQFLQTPMKKYPILIDPEFRALIPPMSADETWEKS